EARAAPAAPGHTAQHTAHEALVGTRRRARTASEFAPQLAEPQRPAPNLFDNPVDTPLPRDRNAVEQSLEPRDLERAQLIEHPRSGALDQFLAGRTPSLALTRTQVMFDLCARARAPSDLQPLGLRLGLGRSDDLDGIALPQVVAQLLDVSVHVGHGDVQPDCRVDPES